MYTMEMLEDGKVMGEKSSKDDVLFTKVIDSNTFSNFHATYLCICVIYDEVQFITQIYKVTKEKKRSLKKTRIIVLTLLWS